MKQESNNSPFSLFNDLIIGIQIIDTNFKYIYINETAAKHGKTTPDKLIGRTMMDAYPDIENTKLFQQIRKCIEEKQDSDLINEFTQNDNSKGYFQLRIQSIPEGALIMSVDITKEKNTEIELNNLNIELDNKNKEYIEELASKNKLLHELKKAEKEKEHALQLALESEKKF